MPSFPEKQERQGSLHDTPEHCNLYMAVFAPISVEKEKKRPPCVKWAGKRENFFSEP